MSISKYSVAVAILAIISGISISAIAAYYSISGLMLIFSGAAFSIMIMGIALEIGKIVASVWLKINWKIPAFLIKIYLLIAVTILMGITSMGIFGFLSKSYSNQKLMVNQSQQELIIYDQQLSVKNFELESELARIDSAQKQLAQLDELINQSLIRTADQTTDSAVSRTSRLRQSQSTERRNLNAEIAEAQETILEIRRQISAIELEKLPYTQNVETVESELGPLIYISELVYKDSNEFQLDRAVGWIILLLVLVFDPLALILLLAGLHVLQKLDRSPGKNNKTPKITPTLPTDSSGEPKKEPSNEPPEPPSTPAYLDGPVVQPDGSNAWYADGKKYQNNDISNNSPSLYTQNEEQAVSGVWSNLKNLISRKTYNSISEEKEQSTIERLNK